MHGLTDIEKDEFQEVRCPAFFCDERTRNPLVRVRWALSKWNVYSGLYVSLSEQSAKSTQIHWIQRCDYLTPFRYARDRTIARTSTASNQR